MQNANIVACKFGPVLIRAIYHKLKVAREKQQNREEIVERQKIKVMAAQYQRARRGISFSSKEEENYESDIRNETDPDQAGNNKNPLQF